MSARPRSDAMLRPGRNCWRVEHAARAAFLVDGEAYFSALRAAAARARRTIFILGWDIDSRTRLVPEGAGDGLPEALGAFLDALARRSRALEIHVLDWDFAMIYAADRELLPIYKLGWRTHGRVHFHLDDSHPAGASHHQKIVVIDDSLAFVGGLDLTHCRWDTPAHLPGTPARRHPDGSDCMPFHDLQMAVDGDVAAALGDLARERWRRATGRCIPVNPKEGPDPWPPGLAPDLTDVPVAIARTEPPFRGRTQVQEIKQLYLDAIAAARRALYFENQYFSSAAIADALAARLIEPEGPEIALVSRRKDSGWLEESTVGVMRARLNRSLRAADRRGRYASFYPDAPGLGEDFINVHAKVLVMDDELVTIGSANLNNRSMGLDTECNLAIEAGGDGRVRTAIVGLRRRLLAEHLGVAPAAVAAAEGEAGGLLATIAALAGGKRSLRPLEPETTPELDALVPAGEFLDPEQPVAPERLVAELLPAEERGPGMRRLLLFATLLVALLGLAAAWRWTPLGERLDLEALKHAAGIVQTAPAAPLLMLAMYVLAGLLVVPATVLIVATALVFGPWQALAYGVAGSVLSAAVTYGLGRALGRNSVRRLAGAKINRLSRELARRGLLAVIVVRIVPIAPFSVVNLVAGASHIGVRDFLVGTALGVAPGALLAVIFTDRIAAAVREPGAETLGFLLALVVLFAAGLLALRRLLRRREDEDPGR